MVSTPSSGRSGQQARLFRVYNYYRIVISIMLVVLLILDTGILSTQHLTPIYFQATALSYLALNTVIGLALVAGYQVRPWHITVSILVDIFILHVLAMFSSGIGTGVANLVVISVAAGNILIPSRIGIFFAALATIFSLTVSSFLAVIQAGGVDDIVRAGFMGAIYFAAAFILQNITRRLASSEKLATERARSIAQLEELNHQIIRRMHTGIIVADGCGEIRMANAASGELLLGEREASNRLEYLPQPLKLRLEQWLNDPGTRSQPFQARAETAQVQANFTRLDDGLSNLILIFLEDTAKVIQQAQQMKLASLGRLTAGIAHEVRNPLGAISHAAQLLGESQALDEGDRRMAGIIQRHSQRVNAIIENVLELSRRRTADVRLMDLGQWLARVVNEYRESCGPQVAIDLKLRKGPAMARFDPSQLHQVLINLMDNGLRYSEKQTGTPSLTLSTGTTEDGQRAYVDIQDHGPGFSEQQRASLFEPFFTTEQNGTGLGLYLARELCEANQAQLTLLRNTSEGCCFRITFAHPQRRVSDYNELADTAGADA